MNNNTTKHRARALGSRPEFYLVYLLFYFIPWFFQPPSTTDVVAIVVALAVFLPVYVSAFKDPSRGNLPHIIAIALIGYALSPYHGSFGVFHIYATVQASFVRPERRAWIGVICLSAVFLAFSLLTEQHWSLWVFPVFMALLIAVGTMHSAEQEERQEILERSREHDTQLAALAERERIAQDLHDLLGQTLTVVALKSEVASKLIDKDIERAKQEIEEIRLASRNALTEVREAVADMNRTTISREINRAKTILESAGVMLQIVGEVPILDANTDRTLGLAIREATTNIVRHANARKAKLTISHNGNGLEIVIEDNGSGAIEHEGSGLSGLRRRIEALGGATRLEANSGVRVTLQLPLANQ